MSFDHASNLIIQFAKAPIAGEVKTRLSPVLNPLQRLSIHCEMMAWVCANLHDVGCAVELWVAGNPNDAFIQGLQRRYRCTLQQQVGEDLGQRMANAILQGLRRYDRVLIVGSDCPFVDKDYLDSAFHQLQYCDVVIGPADDGGYVLLGLKQFHRQLFTGIDWGSAEVLQQSKAAIARQQLSSHTLATLSDIDRPEDLPKLNNAKFPKPLRAFAQQNPERV